MPLDVNTTPIQGKDVYTMISDDNEANWYTLVCAEKAGYKSSFDVKQRNTQCGPVVGIAPSLKRQISFEGVFNQVDDALVDNAGFASGKKMKEWNDNQTALIVKQLYDDGSQLGNKYACYLSEFNEDIPMDDVVSISITLELFGNAIAI